MTTLYLSLGLATGAILALTGAGMAAARIGSAHNPARLRRDGGDGLAVAALLKTGKGRKS